MKQVYIAIILALTLGLAACGQKLADVAAIEAVMAESPVILPAPIVENKTLDTGVCASDGIGGTGCPAID